MEGLILIQESASKHASLINQYHDEGVNPKEQIQIIINKMDANLKSTHANQL